MKKIRLNLVQLVFFPIVSLVAIMGLSFWLRDLIILEWDITPQFASVIGWIINGAIIALSMFVVYCIIKFNKIITKFVSPSELERELNLIKSRD